MAKRGLDVVLALVGLIIAAPIMALIAAAIRIDTRGPILYIGRRAGLGGRPFGMLKFRTMHADAPSDGPALTLRKDWRVRVSGTGSVGQSSTSSRSSQRHSWRHESCRSEARGSAVRCALLGPTAAVAQRAPGHHQRRGAQLLG